MNFVYRNATIEFFLDKGWVCSGYADVSTVPEGDGVSLWWYVLPFSYDRAAVADEVRAFPDMLRLVLDRTKQTREVVALTVDLPRPPRFVDSDNTLEDAVEECNAGYRALARDFPNLKVLDIREFTSTIPRDRLIDWKFYFMAQAVLDPKLAVPFKHWFARKLESIAFKRKKCLVIDLDNTLWGGVLGEDGIDGIKIGGGYPGIAYLLFQQGLKELEKSGTILAVCSKNNEQDVLDAWEKNPFMALHKDDFAAWRINWNDKASNIRELASELNIGLDSMVFADDSPIEREFVQRELPMVEVPEFPSSPYGLPDFFEGLVSRYFRVYALTGEDRMKTKLYKANAMRENERKTFHDMDSFLKSLGIRLKIEPANAFTIPRIAQMTEKTNQFNLTTRRRTESEIRMLLSSGWRIWTLSVSDKFGDSGVTGCAMVTPEGGIDTFLLSCRVLGRGIEDAFLKYVCKKEREGGAASLEAEYVPSPKNRQVEEFYAKNGFEQIALLAGGTKRYKMDLAKADLSISPLYKIDSK